MANCYCRRVPLRCLAGVLQAAREEGLAWLWVGYSDHYDMLHLHLTADLPALDDSAGFVLEGRLFGEAGEVRWVREDDDVRLVVTWDGAHVPSIFSDEKWSPRPLAQTSGQDRRIYLWGEPAQHGTAKVWEQQRVGRVGLPLVWETRDQYGIAVVRLYDNGISAAPHWRLVGLEMITA
jgi:hypothetical protein